MTPIRIYTLTDPRTNQVFYVGASKQTDNVLLQRHSTKKTGIRSELKSLKLKPIVEILDRTTKVERAASLEEYWFYQFKSWGFKMENSLRNGFNKYSGDGRDNCVQIKKAINQKIAALLPNITSVDKIEAMAKFNITRQTLAKYLNKEIYNVDKAIALMQFFKNKQNPAA